MRSLLAWAVPLLLTPNVGCVAGDDESFAQLPCDILAGECQRAVYRATAEVAQLPAARMPPLREISVRELEAELRARSEPEESATEQGWSRALALLGLLPEGQSGRDAAIEHQAQSIGAFYDAELKLVSVVNRGRSEPEQDLFVLAHELSHALRDAESDLLAFRERYATSTDSYAATNALVEGEAMVVGASVVARAAQGAGYRVEWSRFSASVEKSVFDTIDGSEAPLIAAYEQLPYAFGTRQLGPLWDAPGPGAIAGMYEQPLLTLLPWSRAIVGVPATQPLQCFPTTPPPGYAGADSDSLGLVGLVALQVALGTTDARDAVDASQSWHDDRMVVFAPVADGERPERALAWRMRFASPEAAGAFAQRIDCCLPEGVQMQQLDHDLLLLAADEPGLLERWSEAGSCGRAEDVPRAEDD